VDCLKQKNIFTFTFFFFFFVQSLQHFKRGIADAVVNSENSNVANDLNTNQVSDRCFVIENFAFFSFEQTILAASVARLV
jgi:regulatory protein YycI of two-component signal transduction system YycFG